MDKPAAVFDRDEEWAALRAFVLDAHGGPTLGVVSGRRRQGKTLLLQALTQANGGFYHEAAIGSAAEQLRRLGASLAAHLRLPVPLELADWEAAIRALMGLGGQRPTAVVLDELPYFVDAAPGLPSLLQAALAPLSDGDPPQARLLVCGSAVGLMGRLLGGNAPLRGRAGLMLLVQPFSYRVASQFWAIADAVLALRTFAVVGGTPAYRREFVRSEAPADAAQFDDWVVRVVLDRNRPLLHEGRYLLAEDPDLSRARDRGLYVSALAAVAAGHRTHARIAGYLGRRSEDLTYVLAVLEDAGLLVRREDLLRRRRPTYDLADPFLRFHLAVIRPSQSALAAGSARQVWRDAQPAFHAQVLGPMFEEVCRTWVRDHAHESTVGGPIAEVGSAVVSDPAGRARHEIDVLALGPRARDGRRQVRVIGEAKWGGRLGPGDLQRLESVRALLQRRDDLDAGDARLLLATAGPPHEQLRPGPREDLVLVDPPRLLHGG